ncbi:phosphoesterase [Francisella sp. Scap27]|uniref:metallophosphoesterase n=1 Tax=Francisella sp. Scap27 TaxID=2589986 RepID=UPI0015BEF36A|nr:metallophosphoesterase [Francisella sp. Scap27]QLE78535.1 phosphoesterase [Francisella sp. Scap27]
MLFKQAIKISITLSLLTSLAIANTTKQSDADNYKLLTISDIHLNANQKNIMESDPKGYNPKNDMDKDSFDKIMERIAEYNSSNLPNSVLYLGDAVGHDNTLKPKDRAEFVTKNETLIYKSLQKSFPNTPIINVFGNNDSAEKNYGSFESNNISPYTIAIKSGFKNGFLSSGEICDKDEKVFPCLINQNTHTGFFSIKLENKFVLIGLNTVMYTDISSFSKEESNQQFEFLKSTLKNAKDNDQTVLIATHIPFGNNIYDGSNFFNKNYTDKYLKLIKKYHNHIAGILVGHTHIEELKILPFKDKVLGEYYTAGLSTSHGNSPSYKTYSIHKNSTENWSIDDYIAYQLHSNKNGDFKLSELYSFAKSYCKEAYQNDINICLTRLNETQKTKDIFSKFLPKMTVDNPKYPVYKANSPESIKVNTANI